MGNAGRKYKKINKNGFTLVELIVVLVILGILAAILIPSMVGWLNKAKDRDAILECRSAVVAAQGMVAEEYGKKSIDRDLMNLRLNESDMLNSIREIAGVSGTITGHSIIVDEHLNVTNMTYVTEKNIKVVYNRAENPVYQIKTEGSFTKDPPGYNAQVDEIKNNNTEWNENRFLDEKGNLKDEYAKYFGGKWEVRGNDTKRLQAAYLEKYGSFPTVDLDSIKFPEGISWQSSSANQELVWKPILAADGTVVMTADSYKTMGQSSAKIIYCNGKYYYHRVTENSSFVNGAPVSDKSFTTDLINADNNWIEFPNK